MQCFTMFFLRYAKVEGGKYPNYVGTLTLNHQNNKTDDSHASLLLKMQVTISFAPLCSN
ncbi:hypothetical protein glysoja_017671 [Glycine soja]|nr:hypothetical protein glysoja_017671 [Glycine soja]